LPTFFKNKKRLENKKTFKNVKTRDQNKKRKTFFYIYGSNTPSLLTDHTLPVALNFKQISLLTLPANYTQQGL